MTEINLPISCAEVYWCIADFESVNSQKIAEKTGLAKSTVQGHLSALEKTGAIKGQGRPKQYCVSEDTTPETLEWLRKFEELARMTLGLRYKEFSQSTSRQTEIQLDSLTTPVAGCNYASQSSNPWRILSSEEVGNLFGSVIIVRVPEEPGESVWHSTWINGEWTHQRKASSNSELEPPPEKRITRAEVKTAFRQLRKTDIYKGHLLSPMPCVKDNKLAWSCDIDLVNGKRFHGSNSKSFDSVEAALNWAKTIIDEADGPLFLEGQALEQHLDAAQSYLMSSASAMLRKYLPQANDRHSLLLKYLIRQFQNQGTDTFWEYFVARGFALTSRKFLSICRDLAKSGLIRYSRYTAAHMMEFYLGPAWLSLEGVVLTQQELQAIAKGEQVASYHPWSKSAESYPGEKYGFPCLERTERNIGYFHQGLGMSAKCILRQEGNVLVRVPVNPNYPTWYSTWQDGFWTHKGRI